MEDTKVCSKCGDEKSLEDFEKDKRTRDGRGSSCKKCKNLLGRRYDKNQNNKLYRRKRQELNIQLKSKPCTDCKIQYHWSVMQWDHRPGEIKLGDIARFVNNMDEAGLLNEIAKCDLVCANCHALRTYLRKNPDELPTKETI